MIHNPALITFQLQFTFKRHAIFGTLLQKFKSTISIDASVCVYQCQPQDRMVEQRKGWVRSEMHSSVAFMGISPSWFKKK